MPNDSLNMERGVVTRSTGSWYQVYLDKGWSVSCRLRGQYRLKGVRTTNPVSVGDHVTLRFEENQETAVIVEIEPRKNYIIRKATNLSREAHIIASNIDQAMIVATIDQPRTSTGFIDRFLATAEAYHIPVVIVFNKIDLYQPAQWELLHYYREVYVAAGYKVELTSVYEMTGIEKILDLLKDKVTLISGHSGVGKSAIINAIDPELDLKTGEISNVHNKGKHTTTFAEMFRLSCGAWIVDTPGIKEFGLHDIDDETLAQRFPEMRAVMSDCRFANCTHLQEPGCAVKLAVENGQIADFRYQNYVNMLSAE